ncbi:hypothetical protein ABGV42_01060 [Paenibacillus pabuli]|uniref:hypothetical protein n=1 Tax=Paenibacillus pabuli TaxID=1472 RepID=UPI003241F357
MYQGLIYNIVEESKLIEMGIGASQTRDFIAEMTRVIRAESDEFYEDGELFHGTYKTAVEFNYTRFAVKYSASYYPAAMGEDGDAIWIKEVTKL